MLLAQITDTHIKPGGRLAYGRVDTVAALKDCVAALNALAPRPDAVVATGDLTDAGSAGEFALLADLLAPLAMPLYLLPGNHDSRDGLRQGFPRHGYLPRDGRLDYVVELGELRLICLDSLEEGQPYGRLAPETLDFLRRRLEEAPGRPSVVALHHPPFATGIGHMDRQNLRNADDLAAVLDRHPQVLRVICGHVHRNVFGTVGRTPASIAPSPAHLVALDLREDGPSAFRLEPAGFQLHRVVDGRLVTHNVTLGDWPGPYPFFEPDGRLID